MAASKRKRTTRNSEHGNERDKKYPSRKKQSTINETERRTTRSMTTDASRRAVFDTAELLENILIHLTMFEIARCRSVSSQFRDCINGSTMIAEKLFLKPRKNIEVWTRIRDGDQINFTRSTEPASAVMRKLPTEFPVRYKSDPSISMIILPELCPLLTGPDYRRFSSSLSHSKRDRTSFNAPESTLRILESIVNNQDVQCEPARMYLSEAPSNAINVDIIWQVDNVLGNSQFGVRRDQPVTLGDVVSSMLQADYRIMRTRPQISGHGDGSMRDLLESRSANGVEFICNACWFELHGVLVPTAQERRLMKD